MQSLHGSAKFGAAAASAPLGVPGTRCEASPLPAANAAAAAASAAVLAATAAAAAAAAAASAAALAAAAVATALASAAAAAAAAEAAVAGELGAAVLSGVLGEECPKGVDSPQGAEPMGVGIPRRDASPMAGDLEVPMVLRSFFGMLLGPVLGAVVGDLCEASAMGGPCRRFVGEVAMAEAMKERSSAPFGVL